MLSKIVSLNQEYPKDLFSPEIRCSRFFQKVSHSNTPGAPFYFSDVREEDPSGNFVVAFKLAFYAFKEVMNKKYPEYGFGLIEYLNEVPIKEDRPISRSIHLFNLVVSTLEHLRDVMDCMDSKLTSEHVMLWANYVDLQLKRLTGKDSEDDGIVADVVRNITDCSISLTMLASFDDICDVFQVKFKDFRVDDMPMVPGSRYNFKLYLLPFDKLTRKGTLDVRQGKLLRVFRWKLIVDSWMGGLKPDLLEDGAPRTVVHSNLPNGDVRNSSVNDTVGYELWGIRAMNDAGIIKYTISRYVFAIKSGIVVSHNMATISTEPGEFKDLAVASFYLLHFYVCFSTPKLDKRSAEAPVKRLEANAKEPEKKIVPYEKPAKKHAHRTGSCLIVHVDCKTSMTLCARKIHDVIKLNPLLKEDVLIPMAKVLNVELRPDFAFTTINDVEEFIRCFVYNGCDYKTLALNPILDALKMAQKTDSLKHSDELVKSLDLLGNGRKYNVGRWVKLELFCALFNKLSTMDPKLFIVDDRLTLKNRIGNQFLGLDLVALAEFSDELWIHLNSKDLEERVSGLESFLKLYGPAVFTWSLLFLDVCVWQVGLRASQFDEFIANFVKKCAAIFVPLYFSEFLEEVEGKKRISEKYKALEGRIEAVFAEAFDSEFKLETNVEQDSLDIVESRRSQSMIVYEQYKALDVLVREEENPSMMKYLGLTKKKYILPSREIFVWNNKKTPEWNAVTSAFDRWARADDQNRAILVVSKFDPEALEQNAKDYYALCKGGLEARSAVDRVVPSQERWKRFSYKVKLAVVPFARVSSSPTPDRLEKVKSVARGVGSFLQKGTSKLVSTLKARSSKPKDQEDPAEKS